MRKHLPVKHDQLRKHQRRSLAIGESVTKMSQADEHELSLPADFSQPSRACLTRSGPSSRSISAAPATTEPLPSPIVSLRRRSSAFVEVGLYGDDAILDAKLNRFDSRLRKQVGLQNEIEISEPEDIDGAFKWDKPQSDLERHSIIAHLSVPSFTFLSMPRLILLAALLAFSLPSLYNSPLFSAGITPIGANAGPTKDVPAQEIRTLPEELVSRDNSPTNICTRWSHQTAVVNNTLYIYGGRAKLQASQTSNTWSGSTAWL
jgi:hypothetical protein